MPTIGSIGAGEVGSQIARAAIAQGPGQPAWRAAFAGQSRDELPTHLAQARRTVAA